jgi:hypothetical protein
MRRLACILLLVVAFPSVALGQGGAVSDADREAARNLFKEGFTLQAAGSYADALDRFRRSQQVYPAPTALLHIAECEAKLGRLVEAAETYRTLAREPLPPNPPPPFVAAQAQGAAELQQIEPRIPHIRIDVTPVNAPGMVVTIDGQAMNVALLGVERPVDPGDHVIVASAPGFEKAEATVTVAEKQTTKMVGLLMKPLPELAVPVVVGPPVAAPQGPRIVYVQGPPQPYPVTPYYVPRPAPAPAPPPETPAVVTPPGPPESRTGFFVGPRLGAVYPGAGGVIGSDVATGFTLGGELSLRFARRLFLGAVFDHGFLATGSNATNPSATFSTTGIDAEFGVITNPDHVAAVFDFGGGYRVLEGSDGTSVTSPEAILGIGLWIPTGHVARLVPRIDGTFGSFSGNAGGVGQVSSGYAMINFLIAGYFNWDFKPDPAR